MDHIPPANGIRLEWFLKQIFKMASSELSLWSASLDKELNVIISPRKAMDWSISIAFPDKNLLLTETDEIWHTRLASLYHWHPWVFTSGPHIIVTQNLMFQPGFLVLLAAPLCSGLSLSLDMCCSTAQLPSHPNSLFKMHRSLCLCHSPSLAFCWGGGEGDTGRLCRPKSHSGVWTQLSHQNIHLDHCCPNATVCTYFLWIFKYLSFISLWLSSNYSSLEHVLFSL